MTTLLVVSLITLVWSVGCRILPMFVMQDDMRWDQPLLRLGQVFKMGIGQARFMQRFEITHGILHIMIFWGFLVVSINNIHLIGRGFVENWSLPGFHETDLGLTYAFLKNLFALSIMAGTLFALGRRVILKPERMILSLEANLILLWICGIELTDVVYEGTLFMIFPGHPEQNAAFLSSGFMSVLSNLGYEGSSSFIHILHSFGYWGHIAMALAFLNYLPYCKQFHELTALPNLFFSKLTSQGELVNQDFENANAPFGVAQIEDFSWKRALDMHSCAECGRCQANCPAHSSEKPLSPMQLILEERDHFKEKAPLMCSAANFMFRKQNDKVKEKLSSWSGDSLSGDVIEDEAVWSCTTCGHCISNCPMKIEHIDNIVDLRRNLVQLSGRIPKELSLTFKNWQYMSNPWGLASNSRGDWLEDLGVETPQKNQDFEYLYYVGCAGSFDDRNKKIATAFVQMMQKAGVNFACLGNDEKCCGETARRLGNEYLGQTMIRQNIETLNAHGVKKIVTACPHCYNTLNNEYPGFGGDYEVIHHAEMIMNLIDDGRLKLEADWNQNAPVVFHDPCYLGRHNGDYKTSRNILSAVPGVKTIESERTKNVSFCCGGGGGRMWMEEKNSLRINEMRCDQLVETGAKNIVTACPYCLIMLDDAIKEKSLEDEVRVMDLTQVIAGPSGR